LFYDAIKLAAIIDKPDLSSKATRSQTFGSSMGRNRLTVNGVTHFVEGNNISVRNGVIYADGVAVHSGLDSGIHITWYGDLASLQADGSVTCDSVQGDVIAGGSVKCHNVSGNVGAHGSVKAGRCGGNIIAGGSVISK
jgi:hypothetical protein